MNALHITTVAEKDGEIHLTSLPIRKGDRVEAVLILVEHDADGREHACERFLARAAATDFCSSGPYPSRDELHE